jgi:hypothetical protein
VVYGLDHFPIGAICGFVDNEHFAPDEMPEGLVKRILKLLKPDPDYPSLIDRTFQGGARYVIGVFEERKRARREVDRMTGRSSSDWKDKLAALVQFMLARWSRWATSWFPGNTVPGVGPNLPSVRLGPNPQKGFPMEPVEHETDVEWPSRPAKMTIGLFVFVFGIAAGAGLAMWVLPPSWVGRTQTKRGDPKARGSHAKKPVTE